MIDDESILSVFRHYGKVYNKEVSDVWEANNHGFDCTTLPIYLPTKDECRKKIESLQTTIKKLKSFLKKSRFTDEEIEKINDDMNCLLQGCRPGYMQDYSYAPVLKKERKKQSGFIYFLQEHTGKVKIGKTKFLSKRILDLGIKFPIKPILIHSFSTEDITESERKLHKKYHKFRLEGEWFKLSKREIEKIKEQYPQNQNQDDE